MRLIDADTLKADYGMADECKECRTNVRTCEYDRTYTKMDFCGWLDDAPTVPQWIPVTERLPTEDGLYLVTTSKGQVQMHVFSHYGNSEEYWMRCNKAWMKLPAPWKEGQE